MTIREGTRLGPYEIVAPLGAGGMGEVWRARDTRLGREVALKFLPAGLADDPERHARFEREARLLAALNHPNVAMLYGLEHLDGQHALAMELVEGEGLDERLRRGPIPVEEAISIAGQIAEALEAAHEKGIVHRDLKPANVKVRSDGTVKVLDFGLAKAWEEPGTNSELAYSPTITAHHTRAGVILGTAAYMAPEQARGKAVDKRADIWAFGCVVYEMLTGERLFQGETLSDILAAVLKTDPNWSLLPSSVPGSVRRVLARCLERDPHLRVRDIRDVRLELHEAAEPASVLPAGLPVAPAVPVSAARRIWLPWVVTALSVAFAGAVAWHSWRSRATHRGTVRSYILPPDNVGFAVGAETGGAVISPAGTRLVFAAGAVGAKTLLWVRPLGSLTAQPLEGTEGGSFPFWSPDGRFVGFFVHGQLKKIDTLGGPAQAVCEAANGRGGTWGAQGVIVFAPDVFTGLYRVASAGGSPVAVTKPDTSKRLTSERWPFFLPDGRHFLFWAGIPDQSTVKSNGIYSASLDGGVPQFIVAAESNALYAPPGYLLYMSDRSLMAQPFDADRLRTTGDAFPIAEQVVNPEHYRLGRFSVSTEGTLVYLAGEHELRQMAWLTPTGGQLGTVGEPADIAGSIRPSPNGEIVAEPVMDPKTRSEDIWLVDLARAVKTRFTFDPKADQSPVWSPDGSRIVWSSYAKGHMDLYVKNASGAGDTELLFASDVDKFATDWSRDGRFVTFTSVDSTGKTGADLWVLPMTGDRKPFPVLATQFDEGDGVFSPDGRWLAYESDESGTDEIYITPFPRATGKWQVSQGGGEEPLWRADGRAVYYTTPGGTVMEAPAEAGRDAVEVGTPREFCKAQLTGFGSHGLEYAVSPKGDRLLVVRPAQTAPVPLTLVTDWTEGLRR